MIIAFVLWSIVSVLFLGIGISCRRSKETVGFFAFVKPPDVEETGRYNRAVGTLWLVAAGIFEVIGIPFIFLQQNSPFFLLIIFAVIILILGMMIAYIRIEARYRKNSSGL